MKNNDFVDPNLVSNVVFYNIKNNSKNDSSY